MSDKFDVPLEWEDRQDSASSVSEYYTTIKETYETLSWLMNQIRTPEIIRWWKRALLFVMFATALEVSAPFAVQYIIAAAGVLDWHAGIFWVLILAAVVLLKNACIHERRRAREFVLGYSMARLDEMMIGRFFEKSVGQHQQDGSKLSVANIDKGRTRTINIQNAINFEGIPSFALLVSAMGALTLFSPTAGLIMFLTFSGYCAFSIHLNNWLRAEADLLDAAWRSRTRYMFNRLKHVERVKTSGYEEEEARNIATWYDKILTRDRSLWLAVIGKLSSREAATDFSVIAVLLWGVYCVFNGTMNITNLFPLYMISNMVAGTLWRLSDVEHQINYNLPAVKSMKMVLSAEPEVKDVENPIILEKQPVSIEFRNVSLCYSSKERGSRPTLKNINFTAKAGSKTALIGVSGAGKTSIGKLVMRSLDPTEGTVLINGIPLTQLKRTSWLKMTAYIPQQIQIFDGTLRHNIEYGLTFDGRIITDEEIERVVTPVQADFGARLDKGYDTEVGENGLKLSGGQGQRVSIAAAVMRDPSFVLLDESTSSLDSSTERKVQQGLRQVLSSKVTAIVIAHRLDTVRDCDQFIVLRQPHEVSEGESQIEAIASSFEELHEISEIFRELARDQGLNIRSAKAA